MSTYAERRRTYAGLGSYDERRDPWDHRIDKVLPEDPGPVHAVPKWKRDAREPEFLPSWQYARGLCSAVVKVLLAVEFDGEDPDACPRCVTHLENGTRAPERDDQEEYGFAKVRSEIKDGRTLHWFVCSRCGGIGLDRVTFGEALREAQDHNRTHD